MQPLCLSLCVAAAAYLAPTNGKRRTTRLAAMREFRAQDLTLERFLGQVSVTEVTDWEYSGEGVNPLDPAQPARTKSDAGVGSAPLRLFLATREDPTARARGEDLRCCVREYSRKASSVARQELDAFRERDLPKKSVCQLLGTLDDSEDGFFSSDAVLDDSFIEAWVANLRCEPPQPDSRWLVYEWAGTCTFASLTAPPGPQNPFYAEPPRPFGGGIFGSRAVGERWTYAQRERFVLRAIKDAVACVAETRLRGPFAQNSLAAILLNGGCPEPYLFSFLWNPGPGRALGETVLRRLFSLLLDAGVARSDKRTRALPVLAGSAVAALAALAALRKRRA